MWSEFHDEDLTIRPKLGRARPPSRERPRLGDVQGRAGRWLLLEPTHAAKVEGLRAAPKTETPVRAEYVPLYLFNDVHLWAVAGVTDEKVDPRARLVGRASNVRRRRPQEHPERGVAAVRLPAVGARRAEPSLHVVPRHRRPDGGRRGRHSVRPARPLPTMRTSSGMAAREAASDSVRRGTVDEPRRVLLRGARHRRLLRAHELRPLRGAGRTAAAARRPGEPDAGSRGGRTVPAATSTSRPRSSRSTARCSTARTRSAAHRAGTIISGRYGQKRRLRRGLFSSSPSRPELTDAPSFRWRGGLPSQQIADSTDPDKGHKLYAAPRYASVRDAVRARRCGNPQGVRGAVAGVRT